MTMLDARRAVRAHRLETGLEFRMVRYSRCRSRLIYGAVRPGARTMTAVSVPQAGRAHLLENRRPDIVTSGMMTCSSARSILRGSPASHREPYRTRYWSHDRCSHCRLLMSFALPRRSLGRLMAH